MTMMTDNWLSIRAGRSDDKKLPMSGNRRPQSMLSKDMTVRIVIPRIQKIEENENDFYVNFECSFV